MLILSPSDGLRGDGTAYIPRPDQDYEAWICRDVIDCARELFPFTGQRAPVFIAGLSMGGYGALRLGAKYAIKFKGISAHSAITRITQMEDFVHDRFPVDGLSPEELDIVHWMCVNKKEMPILRFDCGREDALFEANCAFHARLERHQIPHEFFMYDGNHSWPYWQAHIADTLLFCERTLHNSSLPRGSD
jgi:S-formylglutathione hydrolase FrmB